MASNALVRTLGLILVCSVQLLVKPASAAAPVAELGGTVSPSMGQAQASPSPSIATTQRVLPPESSPSVDSYSLIQNLREELSLLRGLLEEQGNEIRQLKQRQIDDYLDLDRRLGVSGSTGAKQAASVGSANADQGAEPLVRAPVPGAYDTSADSATSATVEDQSAYDQSYDLLKAGKVDEAKIAFNKYLSNYPQGYYIANAQYWLGEIYMLDNQLAEAGKAFSVVVEQFPAHRKVLDASFKLGKVYYLQGDKPKAKVLLTKVAGTASSAGKLARDYLEANF